ncbi:PTS system sorbose subIIB component family protein [Clostridium baratii str. Sullivan]|uniref:PTS system sorbose subIIB component family protein n=1 Tax=Clostridium baratii str. Sullivan TaxID=1415775 RepID=A0A0A7FYE6_9CLOT|nr:PTS sugar transporter subunit IIB [Clostridium baratii]AIY84623.1 PTS system sorbose subIIB component family protein [Clostridium baratii str. Sullivan]MDU1055057.1 PTS sugar transporter subunit IIB [Clostridium baratii]
MKGIIHIRIDDRLIHGQVAARWSTGLGASRIMVANDEVAADEMQKGILRMVAPPGIATSIISKEKAATNILAEKYANQKVLLVLKSPKDALDLMDRGLEIKEINVGNMAKRDNTVQIKKSLSITKEEFEDFKELMNRGVRLTARMVPDESEVLLENFLSKVSF